MSSTSTSIRPSVRPSVGGLESLTPFHPPLILITLCIDPKLASSEEGRKERKGERSAKTSAPLFFAPLFSLIFSLGTETRTESLENTDHLFFSLTHSLARSADRPTDRPKGRQQSDHDSGRASCLPATDGWIMQRTGGRADADGPFVILSVILDRRGGRGGKEGRADRMTR